MLSSLRRSPLSTTMSSGDLSNRAALTFAQELQLSAVLSYHADLLLCAALLFVFMFNVPRMIARFARLSDWAKGHTLYYSSSPGPKPSIRPHRSASHSRRGRTLASAQDFETAPSNASAYSYSQSILAYAHKQRPEAVYPSFPPHVRSWASLLPRLTPMARFRLNSGFSIGQSAILLLYTGVMIYCSLYKSNPFTDPLRTGFVAMSQIPFVYAFAGKNNIIGLLIGYGHEKVGLSLNLCFGTFFEIVAWFSDKLFTSLCRTSDRCTK
jgi:ferric-chelate reductase